jgi:peptidylprolyl isomerase
MQSRLIVIGVFLVALVVGVIVISATGDDEESPAAEATKPEVEVPDGPPPSELETTDITEGEGTEAQPGDTVEVEYVGVSYSDGQEFDSSWEREEPFSFQLGSGQVIPGWDEGLVGMKVGGRRELVIPPDLAYGKQGSPPAIGPNETLVFVVDLIDVQAAAG